MSLESRPQRVPVTIVAGFLGSGKTTLVNHVLAHADGRKIAVLVNEFGELGIDADLIEGAGSPIIELSNGCICCTVNDDLYAAVEQILARPEALDHIVVETTGVADPLPVALTFRDTDLKVRTRIDSIVTMIDAEHFSLDHCQTDTAYNQILYGDILILNKIDLVPPGRLAGLEIRLKLINPNARILRAARGEVDLPLILSTRADAGDVAMAAQGHDHCDHAAGHCAHDHGGGDHLAREGFSSVSFTTERPFDAARLNAFFSRDLPREVFRAKGIIRLQNNPSRHVFHLCGSRMTLDEDRAGDDLTSRLVLIGIGLDDADLKARLAACLA